METIITQIIVLPEFDTIAQGKDFMANYSNPVYYSVKGKVYTDKGNLSSAPDPKEVNTNKILETNIEPGNIDSSLKYLYREGTFLKYNIETEIE